MISIIIPLYNQAKKVGKCLESIAKQTYDDYEIIVVNDGSSDKPGPILANFKKKFGDKLTIIDQTNQGANVARNNGAKKGWGGFLLFCDADIIMKPDMLATMLETLAKNPQASYAYSSFRLGFKKFKPWPFDAERLKKMPYIHTTSLIREQDFPGFDNSLKKFQDWDLWLTMLGQNHTGILIDRVLYKIKIGGTMSQWLPGFAYKIFPFLPAVKKYNQALAIIKAKHHL